MCVSVRETVCLNLCVCVCVVVCLKDEGDEREEGGRRWEGGWKIGNRGERKWRIMNVGRGNSKKRKEKQRLRRKRVNYDVSSLIHWQLCSSSVVFCTVCSHLCECNITHLSRLHFIVSQVAEAIHTNQHSSSSPQTIPSHITVGTPAVGQLVPFLRSNQPTNHDLIHSFLYNKKMWSEMVPGCQHGKITSQPTFNQEI